MRRAPDGLDGLLARAVRRRAPTSDAGGVLQRLRDPDVTSGAKEPDEKQLTANVAVKDFASSDITYMHKVLYKAVARKASLSAPLLTLLGDAPLAPTVHTVTIDVPPDAKQAVDDIPEAPGAGEKMQMTSRRSRAAATSRRCSRSATCTRA